MDSKDSVNKSPNENIAEDDNSPGVFPNKSGESQQSKSVLAEARSTVNAQMASSSSSSQGGAEMPSGSDRKREGEAQRNGEPAPKKAKSMVILGGDADRPCCSRSIREEGALRREDHFPEADLPNFQSDDEDEELPRGDAIPVAAEAPENLVREIAQQQEVRVVVHQPPQVVQVAPDTDSDDSSSAEDPGPVPNNVPRRRRRRPSSTDEIVDLSSDESAPATPNPPGAPPVPEIRAPRPRPTLQELLWEDIGLLEDIPDDPSMN